MKITAHYASKKKLEINSRVQQKGKREKTGPLFFRLLMLKSPSSYTVCLLLKYKVGLKLFATPPLCSIQPPQNLY